MVHYEHRPDLTASSCGVVAEWTWSEEDGSSNSNAGGTSVPGGQAWDHQEPRGVHLVGRRSAAVAGPVEVEQRVTG
jgi:hypothetical protein